MSNVRPRAEARSVPSPVNSPRRGAVAGPPRRAGFNSPWESLLACLQALLFCGPLAACGGGGSAAGPTGLVIEGLESGAVRPALAAELERRFGDEPWTLRFTFIQSSDGATEGSIHEGLAGLPAEFAYSDSTGTLWVGRVGYRQQGDLLRVTRREGLRWCVDLVARRPEALLGEPQLCMPAEGPRIDALRRAELELSWTFDGEGPGELLADRREALQPMAGKEGRHVAFEGLRTRLPQAEVWTERFENAAREVTRGRWLARSFAGLDGGEGPVWIARPSATWENWLDRAGGASRPRYSLASEACLFALEGHLSGDLRRAGIRGEWESRWGTVSSEALARAAVTAALGTYGDHDLDAWVGHLHRAGLALSLDELFSSILPVAAPRGSTEVGAGSRSELLREPQLAFGLRWWMEHADGDLESLWMGTDTVAVPDSQLERSYAEALNERVADLEPWARRRPELPSGVCLRLPEDPVQRMGKALDVALESASELGAPVVSIEVVAWEAAEGYAQSPTLDELRYLKSRCDLHGCQLALSTHFLDAPSRHILGAEATGTQAQFDADLRRFEAASVHFALLAEWSGASWWCWTSDTWAWMRTQPDRAEETQLDPFEAERMERVSQRWPALIERVRRCFGGGLTLNSSHLSGVRSFAHWEAFDAVSHAFFPEGLASEEGYMREIDLRNKFTKRIEELAEKGETPAGLPWILWGCGVSGSEFGTRQAALRGGPARPGLPQMFSAALLAVLPPPEELGVLWWSWPVGPATDPRGFDLRTTWAPGVLTR